MPKVNKFEFDPEYDVPEQARLADIWNRAEEEYEPFLYGTEWLDPKSILYFKVKQ